MPCMSTTWILTLGILFLVIAVILMVPGFIGRVAWKIGKWLIILFVLLAILAWVSAIL